MHKKIYGFIVMLVFVSGIMAGCANSEKCFFKKLCPVAYSEVHDEVFTYDLTKDVAFSNAMKAVDSVDLWSFESTNYREGLIMARQRGVLGELAVIVIQEITPQRVTVELARNSQRIKGVEELLKAIDRELMKR